MAGQAPFNTNANAYSHRLEGSCLCGKSHGSMPVTSVNGHQKAKERPYTIVKEYDYLDEGGQLAYQALRCRYDDNGEKTYRLRRPDGKGGWIRNMKGVTRLPYRLPELLAADPDALVFVVEGEKCADRVRSEGLIATTNSEGALKFHPDLCPWFAGRNVVITPDNDDPGRCHDEDVAKKLEDFAASIKVVELPGLPVGGDIYDWLEAGHTVDELMALVDATPEWTAGPEAPAVVVSVPTLQVKRLSDVERRQARWLWLYRILIGNLNVLAGDMALGKSQASLDISARVTVGGVWPDGGDVEQGNVLLVSSEDDAATTIGPRFDALGGDSTRLFILDMIVKEGEKDVSLSLADHLASIEDLIIQNGVKLFVIDPLLAFTGGAKVDVNKVNEVRPLLGQLVNMADRTDCAILAIMHTTKDYRQTNSLHRISNSLSFTQAARSVMAVGHHPDDEKRRVMVMLKHNLAPEAKPLGYHFTSDGIFAWDTEEVDIDARAIFAAPDTTSKSAVDAADTFLDEVLRDGPLKVKEIIEVEGKAVGINERAIRRAKANRDGTDREIIVERVTTGNQGKGFWVWKLKENPQDDQDTLLGSLTDFRPRFPGDEATPVRLPNSGDMDTLHRKAAKSSTNGHLTDILPEPVYRPLNDDESNDNFVRLPNVEGVRAREDCNRCMALGHTCSMHVEDLPW
jgi:putative DNA primase/helicase